jgi:hypothetical protein
VKPARESAPAPAGTGKAGQQQPGLASSATKPARGRGEGRWQGEGGWGSEEALVAQRTIVLTPAAAHRHLALQPCIAAAAHGSSRPRRALQLGLGIAR